MKSYYIRAVPNLKTVLTRRGKFVDSDTYKERCLLKRETVRTPDDNEGEIDGSICKPRIIDSPQKLGSGKE